MAPVIQLTQGKVARVSQEDFDFLSQWKWCANKARNNGGYYAVRNSRGPGKRKQVRMHRVIADRAGLALTHQIDHIDGDGLNNTRPNLRAATYAQNNQNRGKTKRNTSGIKGISWDKQRSKWLAQICCDTIRYKLGRFNTKEMAAEAYRKAANKLHKEFMHV